MGGSNDELQDLTNRLVDRATSYGTDVSTEKSKIMTNSTDFIGADNYCHERSEVRGSDQFQVPGSNPVQGWHLLSRRLHQDCLSNGSNGQTKQDLAAQHHQLGKQVQAVQVFCHLHPPPLL